MDLGIQGKTAIVCASSKGLGKACALSLAQEGVNIILNGRTESTLMQTAEWSFNPRYNYYTCGCRCDQ